MTLRTQVLIIGGGPAGSSAARLLAEEGFDTLLLERDFSFVKPCGGGVPSTAFEELRIPGHLAVKHVRRVKVVSPRGANVDVELRGGSIAIVERGPFDRAMRAEAERKGARLLEGEFINFNKIGKSITARLKLREPGLSPGASGSGQDISIEVEADYVVAADGVNSRARAALNIKNPSAFLTLSEKIKAEHGDICEFWFGSSHAPRCYSWVFPHGEGISAGTGSFKPLGIKEFWKKFVLRRGLKTEGRMRGYNVPLWNGDLYNSGKILFAGDSAGQVMPVTYEGIYYALKSGELAAMAIIGGRAGDYRKLWERAFKRRFVLMKRLWSYFMCGDRRLEKVVALHRRADVQEASMNLWLKKDMSKGGLLTYLNIFRKFIS